jgi:signal transduction histidine kinase
VSYRTFKHLLGETSLERKCRFIFGGGILALVTLSFYWYGQKTETLVLGQKTEAARIVVEPIIMKMHLRQLVTEGMETLVEELSGDRKGYASHILNPYETKRGDQAPRDDYERTTLQRFLTQAEKANAATDPSVQRRQYFFPDNSPTWTWRINPGDKREYQFTQAVLFEQKCIDCHYHKYRKDPATGKNVQNKPYDLACGVVVTLPMDTTNKDIHRNRAILISTALVTAILAMVASYVIVRYVIVKPVKHLRDVSDAIAAGKLNIRSQIQTGDEFEELSHAFNRMLHNLVAMQHELKEVNADLDKKVDELAQANLALFEMNRLKSDFLATMSHELRTPLNSIIGFSEVLSTSDSLSEKQRKFASNIQQSGKMLLAMINDILDLAKIEAGKMEVSAEDFSIRDVLEGLTSSMRPMADQEEIDLECAIAEGIPLLRQDPGKLRQIVYNLLSNAIKFTPDGGRVTITARAEGRFVVIAVADTGIGIAEEDRDRVFEKFRQAGGARGEGILTREHEGSGLGLSIVRELTNLLGGEISLESRLGRGTTFTLRLPLQLPGGSRFQVRILDETIDLTKAKRVETVRVSSPHGPLSLGEIGNPRKLPTLVPRREQDSG